MLTGGWTRWNHEVTVHNWKPQSRFPRAGRQMNDNQYVSVMGGHSWNWYFPGMVGCNRIRADSQGNTWFIVGHAFQPIGLLHLNPSDHWHFEGVEGCVYYENAPPQCYLSDVGWTGDFATVPHSRALWAANTTSLAFLSPHATAFGTNIGLFVTQAEGETIHFNTQNSDLLSDSVSAVHVDRQGCVWIGYRWDEDDKTPHEVVIERCSHVSCFRNLLASPRAHHFSLGAYHNPPFIREAGVEDISHDGSDRIWIQTKDKRLLTIANDGSLDLLLESDELLLPCFVADNRGRLLVVGESKLWQVNGSGAIEELDILPRAVESLKHEWELNCSDAAFDKEGAIWIVARGTSEHTPECGYEFVLIVVKDEQVIALTPYRHFFLGGTASISPVTIECDWKGRLWVGTHDQGIFSIQPVQGWSGGHTYPSFHVSRGAQNRQSRGD